MKKLWASVRNAVLVFIVKKKFEHAISVAQIPERGTPEFALHRTMLLKKLMLNLFLIGFTVGCLYYNFYWGLILLFGAQVCFKGNDFEKGWRL